MSSNFIPRIVAARSYAPMSQWGPCGRGHATLVDSATGAAVQSASLPLLIAWLPLSSARVNVGPPLS